MAFKMAIWVLSIMFVATLYNVVSAYSAMESAEVQTRFQEIGILGEASAVMIPPSKPAIVHELAAN